MNAADFGIPQQRKRVILMAGRSDLAEAPLPHVPATHSIDGCDHPAFKNHVGIPGARAYPGHTGSELDQPSKTIKAGVHGVCGGGGHDSLSRWSSALLDRSRERTHSDVPGRL
ncbi:MAG: DNA cytosine methyltransferase [Cyanobacteriota bacterium]